MKKSDKTFLKRGIDYPIVDGARTLPGKYYHSQEIHDEELEKIFYKRWLFALREEEIPNPGDYKLFQIGHESLIILKDEQNEVKALYNVCSHRGTQLCSDTSGNFPNRLIQCPYHAWTYGLDGTLKAAPLMKEGNGFSKKNCALPTAPSYNWEGFIFINLNSDPQPFKEEMDALIGKFSEWKMPDLRIAHHIRYELNCNWKLILQNYQECYHCPGVHPLLSEWTPVQSAQHDYSKGPVIGGFMDITKPRGSMTMNGEAAAPLLCNSDSPDVQRIYYYSIWPNMLFTPHPDYVLYHHITPLGPEKIINDCFWLFDPKVISDPSAQTGIESAVAFWDLTNKQDWQVCEQMQLGTRSNKFTRGYYSGREEILYALDQEVLKALGHDPLDV